jgi:hypothetical protein
MHIQIFALVHMYIHSHVHRQALCEGQEIVSVDGLQVTNMSTEQVHRLLMGRYLHKFEYCCCELEAELWQGSLTVRARVSTCREHVSRDCGSHMILFLFIQQAYFSYNKSV